MLKLGVWAKFCGGHYRVWNIVADSKTRLTQRLYYTLVLLVFQNHFNNPISLLPSISGTISSTNSDRAHILGLCKYLDFWSFLTVNIIISPKCVEGVFGHVTFPLISRVYFHSDRHSFLNGCRFGTFVPNLFTA